MIVDERDGETRYAFSKAYDVKMGGVLFLASLSCAGVAYFSWRLNGRFWSQAVVGLLAAAVIVIAIAAVSILGANEVRMTPRGIQRYTRFLKWELAKMTTDFVAIEKVEVASLRRLKVHPIGKNPWVIEGFTSKEDAEAFVREIQRKIACADPHA